MLACRRRARKCAGECADKCAGRRRARMKTARATPRGPSSLSSPSNQAETNFLAYSVRLETNQDGVAGHQNRRAVASPG